MLPDKAFRNASNILGHLSVIREKAYAEEYENDKRAWYLYGGKKC